MKCLFYVDKICDIPDSGETLTSDLLKIKGQGALTIRQFTVLCNLLQQGETTRGSHNMWENDLGEGPFSLSAKALF